MLHFLYIYVYNFEIYHIKVLIIVIFFQISDAISKSNSQNKNNNDGQIPEASRIDSSEESASDESIIEYSYNKKRKKAKVKKSVGRPEDPVNKEYIKLGIRDKHGHVAIKCKYCKEIAQRGQPSEKSHLALECKDVPGDIKKKYLHIITNSKSSKKKMKIEIQSKITDKFQSTHIDQSQENLINKALTRFFTCCRIPFWIVESLFFIDLLKNLNVGYKPPSRRTLILDGWTSGLHHSYYAFVIITPDRYQYIHSVQDFSSYSHTGSFLLNEIIEEIGPEKFRAVVSDGATAMQLAKNLIIEDDPRALNKKLRGYVTSREFWANIKCLHKVLEPAKIAVKTVESLNIKFADVFLILIKMANIIKAMPLTDTTLERLEF
ncbi:20494_t:CDS:2 [Dentiscutata erythropus]|uniref:20494_t:CDS:1 n=1 Tax=Dentiscutata erythropus TaxID=1348616 RepID=A0A9N8ZF64_9GLOM|nr:20494_t:CDS:2 [Dentiscutata erythropus]